MSSEPNVKSGLVETLIRRIDRAIQAFDKSSIAELIEMYEHPGRMLYLSLLSGVARGFGIAIGFTIVSAVFVTIIVRLAALNLPVIGEFLASIANIVQYEMKAP